MEDAQRVTDAVNKYYAELAKRGMPGGVEDALTGICQDARARLAAQHGDQAAVIDDEWMRGFLERYSGSMSDRLITANRDEVLRLIHGASEGEVDRLLEKLDLWGTERAENMADMETMLLSNELFVAAYRRMGYQSLWIPGAGCCRICQGMIGLTVTTLKPPLHKGCNCTVTAKVAGAFDRRENMSGTTFGVDKNGKYAKMSAGDELETDYGMIRFDRWVSAKKEKVIARGDEIDDVARLIQFYGGKKEDWRKMKNVAAVIEEDDTMNDYDIHWYENDEVGRVDYKTKR